MMKRTVLLCFFIILLLQNSIHLFPFELGVDFRIGNLAFSPDREMTDTTFTGTDFFNWGISLYGSHTLNENLSFSTGLYSDPILRNISYSHVLYTENIFSIGVGPVFGFLNSGVNPLIKPGISALLRVELPAITFIELRADNSLNALLLADEDYIQERTDMTIGFYLPNAICTAGIVTRRFTQLKLIEENGENIFYDYVDSLTEYFFKANIFQKNVPYKLNISFAFQILSKSYLQDTERTDHTLNSIIIGAGIELNFTPSVHFTMDLESSVYTFGEEELLGITNPGPMGYMFTACTGIKVNIDKIIQSGRIEY